ncbi:MAG: tRNA lysidine(34) synthetase TilS [Anaerolineae bacterium]
MMLIQHLRHIVQKNQLILPDETVVVAVSGGTDSLALLHMLYTLQASLRITLHAATLDHQLRDGSAEDAAYVRAIAEEWGIAVTVGHVDVGKLAAEEQMGIEAAARQARYAFLVNVARQVGSARIMTAHHADDQAETVLMRLLRGAGLSGLRGMAMQAPVPGAPHLLLVRPLLGFSRAELEAYCLEHGLVPRHDATNADTRYTRNFIRHEVLPVLRQLNPQVEKALNRLAETARTDDAYLQAAFEALAAEHVRYHADRITVSRAAFQTWHPAMQRRCLYHAIALLGSADAIDFDHIQAAIELAEHGEQGAVALLGAGLRLRVDYDVLEIAHEDAPPAVPEHLPLLAAGQVVALNLPGETAIPHVNWRLRLEFNAIETQRPPQARIVISMYSECILRTRQAGDRIAPLGLNGHHQKINRWMINQKVPRHLRERIPLLVVDGEVALILYGDTWVVSEKFAIRNESQRTINVFVDFS